MDDAPLRPPLPGTVPFSETELRRFLRRVEERVRLYLGSRSDQAEQLDHLRHVADRTRWLYYSELQRRNPGASVSLTPHENDLIEACVQSHDIGKWIPRDALKALLPADFTELDPVFQELKFTAHERDLFLLGVRRKFALAQDGYSPEYDSAHHLVSAYMLVTDPALGFHPLEPEDRQRLIDMIVGHQFGSYFKETLMHLKQLDPEVTTGMLADVARPERVVGDLLASAFHDADISDLLFVGSLERRPNREDILHTGGLVKILIINFTNLILGAPNAPRNLWECIRSCQRTVISVVTEFLTPTAIEHGEKWRRQAHRFLGLLREKAVADKFAAILQPAADTPAPDRLAAVRTITYMHAREFLKRQEE
jgi:hypothetical protein